MSDMLSHDRGKLERLQLLIGARLLAAPAAGVSEATLRNAVVACAGVEAASVQAALTDALLAEELQLEKKRLSLTARGRTAVIERLRLRELPAPPKFEALLKGSLAALALGIDPPSSPAEARSFASASGYLAAVIRAQSPELAALPRFPAPKSVLQAVASQHLARALNAPAIVGGIPPLSKAMLTFVLKVILERSGPLADGIALAHLAARALGVTAPCPAPECRKLILQSWVGPGRLSTAPQPTASARKSVLDLQSFVALLESALRGPEVRRFGGDRVFIGLAYDAVAAAPLGQGMKRDAFDRLLLTAAEHGLVELRRADYIEALDQELLQRSRVIDRGFDRHFIVVDR